MNETPKNSRRRFIRFAAAGVAGAGLADVAAAAPASKFAFAVPTPSVPIAGSKQRFPVRRIYCMGLNYRAHVEEAKDVIDTPPFWFQKSADMVVEDGAKLRYPLLTKKFAYETELVVAIGKGGTNISREKALEHVFGYGVGLDMTRRDLQFAALSNKQPWEPGKSFDESAPCAAIHTVAEVGHFPKGFIKAEVNGKLTQDADVSQLIYDVPRIIELLSSSVELQPGDLIYTGTPQGSGEVVSGDRIVGSIERLGTLTVTIA